MHSEKSHLYVRTRPRKFERKSDGARNILGHLSPLSRDAFSYLAILPEIIQPAIVQLCPFCLGYLYPLIPIYVYPALALDFALKIREYGRQT
jgi:hypothetical protein